MIDGRLPVLESAIAVQPRVTLGTLPTPLEESPRLSQRLGMRILVKRDDLTGLALGGNKVRKLEFLIADALRLGADCIITTGGSQSNHARLTAAACRRFNLDCYLVLDRGLHPEDQGNLLLDRLLAAHVRLLESPDPQVAVEAMNGLADELRADGRTPYVIPRGGSVPAGATGYAAFIVELSRQLADRNLTPTHLYLATGSAGTHSGVMAGATAIGAPYRVQGISVSHPAAKQETRVTDLANAVLRHLGLPDDVDAAAVHVDDRFVGRGYGYPGPGTMEAVAAAALDEALLLDPVYTGKAMAGLIGHAHEGTITAGDTVIFVHTGGSPALFAYNREAASALSGAG